MREGRSPYTVLGLRPGADRATVDEAYRRLMKRHHPDLPGGDPAVAAELNRAHAALKEVAAAAERTAPVPLARAPQRRRERRRGRLLGLLMAVTAVGALYFAPSATLPRPSAALPTPAQVHGDGAAPIPDTLQLRSLPEEEAVAAGVQAARRLSELGLQAEAVSFSRSCEDDLRSYASLSLLDHCVAFDAASGLLGGATPDARFRAEDMAARHVGAAMRVSSDPVLAEERVGNIRRQVEKLLLQPPASNQGVPAGAGAGVAAGAGLGAGSAG